MEHFMLLFDFKAAIIALCMWSLRSLLLVSFQVIQKFEQLAITTLGIEAHCTRIARGRDARGGGLGPWDLIRGTILIRDNWPAWCGALLQMLCPNRDKPSGRSQDWCNHSQKNTFSLPEQGPTNSQDPEMWEVPKNYEFIQTWFTSKCWFMNLGSACASLRDKIKTKYE